VPAPSPASRPHAPPTSIPMLVPAVYVRHQTAAWRVVSQIGTASCQLLPGLPACSLLQLCRARSCPAKIPFQPQLCCHEDRVTCGGVPREVGCLLAGLLVAGCTCQMCIHCSCVGTAGGGCPTGTGPSAGVFLGLLLPVCSYSLRSGTDAAATTRQGRGAGVAGVKLVAGAP
jgi:hypothetical protein